jgi:hypothetical protein
MNQQQCIFCGHIDHVGARQGWQAQRRGASDLAAPLAGEDAEVRNSSSKLR